MRGVALCFVAACELQPAPKQQPAPVAVKSPTVGAGSDAAVVAPKIDPTQPCIDAAIHVAETLIAAKQDPAERSVYEQQRTQIVRGTAEACTTQHWSPAQIACYTAATTDPAIRACEKQFPPPGR